MEKRTDTVLDQGKSHTLLIVLWVVLFCGGFSLFKLLATMSLIRADFGIEYGLTGIMNTAANWAPLILMAPMGYLARRYPPKWTLTVTVIIMAVGNAITATAPVYAVFLVGRVIEGGAQALLEMTACSLTANLTSKNRALVMGTMVSASMIAQFTLLNIGSRILISGVTWRTLFLGIALLQVAVIAVWLAICPKEVSIAGSAAKVKPTKEQTRRVYRLPSLWLIAVAHGIFLSCIVSSSPYIPDFMTTRGLNSVEASAVFSVASLLGVIASVLWGMLSDRFHTKRKIAAISCFTAVPCFILLMTLPTNLLIVFSVAHGLLPHAIIAMTNSSAPDLVETPADVPVANSLREIVSRLTSIIMGVAVGFAIENAGYNVMFISLSVAMVIAGCLWLAAKKVP